MKSILALPTILLAVANCSSPAPASIPDIAGVPDHPTYNHDVRPLLADHCLSCHGSPPASGAPAYFRIDVYADTNGVAGAKSMAQSLLADVQMGTMPPTAPSGNHVGPNGLKLLESWVLSGAPE